MYDASAGAVSFNVGEPPVKQLDKAALPGFLNGTSLGSLLDPGSGFPAIGGHMYRRLTVRARGCRI